MSNLHRMPPLPPQTMFERMITVGMEHCQEPVPRVKDTGTLPVRRMMTTMKPMHWDYCCCCCCCCYYYSNLKTNCCCCRCFRKNRRVRKNYRMTDLLQPRQLLVPRPQQHLIVPEYVDNTIAGHIIRRCLSVPKAPPLGRQACHANSANSTIKGSNFVLGQYKANLDLLEATRLRYRHRKEKTSREEEKPQAQKGQVDDLALQTGTCTRNQENSSKGKAGAPGQSHKSLENVNSIIDSLKCE